MWSIYGIAFDVQLPEGQTWNMYTCGWHKLLVIYRWYTSKLPQQYWCVRADILSQNDNCTCHTVVFVG